MYVSALTGHSSVMEATKIGFSDFPDSRKIENFQPGVAVWEGLQSIGNGCGLQMDGFSAHFEPYRFIFIDFQDVDHFGIDSGGLMLFPEGPRTLRKRPGGPGTS